MSESPNPEIPPQIAELAAELSETGDEFEEISSEEVDAALEALEQLIEAVQSENIRAYLEEASNNIYYLVYDDEDADVSDEQDVADAA